MIRGRCPICARPIEIQALADLPTFPFCSARCRLIDLGRWIDGEYVIPGTEVPAPPPSRQPGVEDEESE